MLTKKLKYLGILISSVFILYSCQDIQDQEKYQHPEWLVGKLYTQLKSVENTSVFVRALELTGYDTIVDVTGSFTIFAPSDEAFAAYFSDNPEYGSSVENIPPDDLLKLVKYHIIQNAWTKDQIQSADIGGWIDEDDPVNNKPRGYKRQTLLKYPNTKYWIKSKTGEDAVIVDSVSANDFKLVYTESRKYIPIFFQEYFNIYDLTGEDYEFYFDRTFSGSEIYYAGAQILGNEIFAENGFIYIIDKVVSPLLNTEELLKKGNGNDTYNLMLNMINEFPLFTTNLEKTFEQEAARAGNYFDTLFNLDYPDIKFNITSELCGPQTSDETYTIRYHNGIIAPSDQAFQSFFDEVLTSASGYPHWASFESVPAEIRKILINSHMTSSPIYKYDIDYGFRNAESDWVLIDESKIHNKYYGSNATFIGLDEVVIPRAFSSVTGPVYLRPGYSTFMLAMEDAKVLPAIKKEEGEYTFYPIPDYALEEDSSLLVDWIDRDLNRYKFIAYNSEKKKVTIDKNELGRRILNHVGTSTPTGFASKEFIENLAGNFIIIDNENNTVRGGSPSVHGYEGDSVVTVTPALLEEPTDNGLTYSVNAWFINPVLDLYLKLIQYPKFMQLLQRVDFIDDFSWESDYMTEGEYYTIFIPSDSALNAIEVDTLSDEEVFKLISYHFVKGELIFTDGKKPSGKYETLRIDDSSTELIKHYSTLDIQTSPDLIEFLDSEGNVYASIPEADEKTNVLVTSDTDEETDSRYDYITTIVIHQIDKVLQK